MGTPNVTVDYAASELSSALLGDVFQDDLEPEVLYDEDGNEISDVEEGSEQGEGEEEATAEVGEGEKEESTTEEESATEEVVEEKEVVEEIAAPKEEVVEPPKSDPVAELQRQLRQQAKEMELLKAKLERVSNRKVETKEKDSFDTSVEEDIEEAEMVTKEELSQIEKYQEEINAISTARSQSLRDMVEVMSLNNDYKDVRDVCTRSRFDDMINAAAVGYVEKNGGNTIETAMMIEANLWKMDNPYRYMYDIIKKHHPDFAKVESASTDSKEATPKSKIKGVPPTKEAIERGKTPASVPKTAVDLGTGGEGKSLSGWTAAKIDAMDELELSKVPKDVYEVYLAGGLDK